MIEIKPFSYEKALVVFEHERKEGRQPMMVLGGLVLADCSEEIAVR